jgi:hypothetical protein
VSMSLLPLCNEDEGGRLGATICEGGRVRRDVWRSFFTMVLPSHIAIAAFSLRDVWRQKHGNYFNCSLNSLCFA